MLEHVVEHHVIQRQNIFHLDVSESVLGRGEVAEGVGNKHAAVVAFDSVQ